MDKEPYTVIKGYELDEMDDDYEMLKGPNGFECVITEPEDRNFGRDLAIIVERLNNLNYEIERKDKMLNKIAYPIQHLQKEATRTGAVLDTQIALSLSNNPEYLRTIAMDALSTEEE